MYGVVIKAIRAVNKNAVFTRRKVLFFPILTEGNCYIQNKRCNYFLLINQPYRTALNPKHYSLKMELNQRKATNVVK